MIKDLIEEIRIEMRVELKQKTRIYWAQMSAYKFNFSSLSWTFSFPS
jgi:hypothetical protein